MTVRVGRHRQRPRDFGGTGYAPDGEVSRDGGGQIDGALRAELERALTAADRANNAVLHERDGRWTVQGDPTEGALIVAARKAGLDAEALDARFERVGEVPFSSERKLMSTIHSDAERRERAARVHQGRARRAARALLARTGGRGQQAADGGAPRRDSATATTSSPARRCARSASRSARCRGMRSRPATFDDERRAGSGLPRPDRHDRPAARGSARRRRARQGRRHPPDHDHRRPSQDGGGDRRGARHRGRRPRRHRRRAGDDVRRRRSTGRCGRCRSMRASIPSTSCASSRPCTRRA